MNIYQGIKELIGHTPLVRLANLERKYRLKTEIIAKLEAYNPAGSVKDRAARSMLEDAIRQGKLTQDAVIIEPTSGNTGIGLASYASTLGLRVILTMPETMSQERRNLLKAYGAELVLTPGKEGMQGAIQKAQELCKTTKHAFLAGQFVNSARKFGKILTVSLMSLFPVLEPVELSAGQGNTSRKKILPFVLSP